jgi:hypothetical protein
MNLPNPDNYASWQEYSRALIRSLLEGVAGAGYIAAGSETGGGGGGGSPTPTPTPTPFPDPPFVPLWLDSSTAKLYLGNADSDPPAGSDIVYIDTAAIADAAITTLKIDVGAVGSANLADLAVVSAKIADAAIVSAKIGDLQVTTGKIGDLAVNSAKIANLAVTSGKIANLAVGSLQIADNAVVRGKIAAGAVTTENLLVVGTAINLVRNPTGEDGSTNSWIIVEQSTPGTVLTFNPNFEITGKPGFTMTKPNASVGAAVGCRAFPVKPGKTYKVTVRLAGSAATAGGLYLRMAYRAVAPTTGYCLDAERDGYTDVLDNGAFQTSYTTYTYQWTCPATANWASFCIYSWTNGAAVVYIADCAVVEQLDTVSIANGAITAQKMQVGTITAASGIIADAAITNAKIVSLVVNKLLSGNLDATIDVGTGMFKFTVGGSQLLLGRGFGNSNQFFLWYGPAQASPSTCTEANGVVWLKTNGSAYFGGSLSAGTLTTKAATSSIAADASAETAVFGSNGGTITVTLSYNLDQFYQDFPGGGSNPGASGSSGPFTVVLERSINGGAYATVATLNLSGTWSWNLSGGTYTEQENAGGSLTYTDPANVAQNRQYRARLTARNMNFPVRPGYVTQSISVICVEQ